MADRELGIDYLEDPEVQAWEDNLDFVMETLSANNSYENGELVKETGPGLLVVQLSNDSIDEYASRMQLNPWDEEEEGYIHDDPGELYDLFRETSKQDGAVIITSNGRILPSNAYLEPPPETAEAAESAPGTGAKHITASRISTLDEVVYAKALSSADGGTTTYVNGEQMRTQEREEFADKWREENEEIE